MKGITTIQGHNSGKTIAIMAGVHGNETGGVIALQKAIETISIDNGVVHYIIGNPKAVQQNVRFTEMNLNRAFIRGPLANSSQEETYERKRALELMPLLETCDALLDVHSVSNQNATPFIICEPENFNLAKKFPFSIISNGWNAVESGGTDYYMNKAGKPGMCVECGQHTDPLVPKRAFEAIKIFLQLQETISGTDLPDISNQKIISVTEIHITATNFQLARTFYDFEPITANELIGHDNNVECRAPRDGVVIFAHNCEGPNQEAFIFGEIN